jgi:DNA topoisomerase IB
MKAPEFTERDEEKVLIGFASEQEARKFYYAHYTDKRFLGKMTEIPFEEFRDAVLQTKENGGQAIAKSHVRSYLRRIGTTVSMVKDFERKRNPPITDKIEGLKGSEEELRAAAKARGYVVPPGWGVLWVAADPNNHMQVRCRDAKGRSPSIYRPDFAEGKAREKFDRMKVFAFAHDKVLARIKADMATKEEARVLYLIAQTGFRLGSDSDTGAEKQAYGASNLQAEHVTVKGDVVAFHFTGKKGVDIAITVKDKTIAGLVSARKKGRLFKTTDDAVRRYMAEITGGKFTPKDFRTFVANEEALRVMGKMAEPGSAKEATKAINVVCDAVAAKLGNTRTVAKSSYIAPEIWGVWKHAA